MRNEKTVDRIIRFFPNAAPRMLKIENIVRNQKTDENSASDRYSLSFISISAWDKFWERKGLNFTILLDSQMNGFDIRDAFSIGKGTKGILLILTNFATPFPTFHFSLQSSAECPALHNKCPRACRCCS